MPRITWWVTRKRIRIVQVTVEHSQSQPQLELRLLNEWPSSLPLRVLELEFCEATQWARLGSSASSTRAMLLHLVPVGRGSRRRRCHRLMTRHPNTSKKMIRECEKKNRFWRIKCNNQLCLWPCESIGVIRSEWPDAKDMGNVLIEVSCPLWHRLGRFHTYA